MCVSCLGALHPCSHSWGHHSPCISRSCQSVSKLAYPNDVTMHGHYITYNREADKLHPAFDDPNYVHYHYDNSTLLTTTSRPPFDFSTNTVRRFHGYHFMQCRGRLRQFWLCWCPSTNPQTPFDDSADTLWRFCGYFQQCRGKTVNYRRGESADCIKFLVTWLYCICTTWQMKVTT